MQVAVEQLRNEFPHLFVLEVQQVARVVEREAVDLLGFRKSAKTRFFLEEAAIHGARMLEMPQRAQSGQPSAQDNSRMFVLHSNLSASGYLLPSMKRSPLKEADLQGSV